MQVVGVEEFRQNLGFFLYRAGKGQSFLVARHGRVQALIRPVRDGDRFPRIGAAALRERAFQVVGNAEEEPLVVTVYDRPAAVVTGAPPRIRPRYGG